MTSRSPWPSRLALLACAVLFLAPARARALDPERIADQADDPEPAWQDAGPPAPSDLQGILAWLRTQPAPQAALRAPTPIGSLPGLASGLQLTAPVWKPLTVIGRSRHSAVYDPVRQRMLVLLGSGREGFFDDVQALRLMGQPLWTPLEASMGEQNRREQAVAIYDPAADRVIVHGGLAVYRPHTPDSSICRAYGDTWELRLSRPPAWRQLEPVGPTPAPRYGHAAIHDPAGKRVLIFGGVGLEAAAGGCPSRRLFADLWELKLGDPPVWRQLAQSGDIPAPGLQGTALYDAVRGRMLFVVRDSVWALALGQTPAWTRLVIAGAGPNGPGAAVLDPGRDRVLVQTGSRTWALSLRGSLAWEELSPDSARPTPQPGFSLLWDPEGDRMVLFGGGVAAGMTCASVDTWILEFASGPVWRKLEQLEQPALLAHQLIYDPRRDRLLAIGGANNPEVFAYELGTRTGWHHLGIGGERPGPRYGHAAVYDPVRDRVFMCGGYRAQGAAADDTTWVLSLTGPPAWSHLPATGSLEPGRGWASLVYDLRRDRLLLFGGVEDPFRLRSGVFELPLDGDPQWKHLLVEGEYPPVSPGHSPRSRYLHHAVYDPVRDRMIVQGGTDGSTPFEDLWALELADTPRWTRLGDSPSQLTSSLVYDPVRDQVLLYSGDFATAQTLAYPLSTPAGWFLIDQHCCGRDDFVPEARELHAAAYDPVRDAMIVSGGWPQWHCTPVLRDVWALTWGTPVRDVTVDIRPGNTQNVVNPGSGGILPVAILSEERFDATTVDPASVKLAGAGVRLQPNGSPMAFTQDVSGDGRADLVLHIESSDLKLAPADTVARLTGSAPGNLTVRGSDEVRVVGNPRPPKPGIQPHASELADGVAADGLAAPALLGVRTLPSGGIAASVRLLPGAPARLGLFDVAGRRLVEVELEGGAGGRREATLGRGHALASGIYWIRLEQAGRIQTRKTVSLW